VSERVESTELLSELIESILNVRGRACLRVAIAIACE
jgi:hypothetical protein